jgi:site-specific recombinase XerD
MEAAMHCAVESFLVACRARGLSARTIEFYGFFLARLESSFADPLGVDLAGLRRWVASLSAWSVASRRGLVRTLKLFYSHSGRGELAAGLVMPRRVVSVPAVLSEDQAGALLRAVHGDPRDWALVVVLLDTALRVSELCGLAVGDLELRTGFAVVRRGKGGKGRVVPLGRVAVDALRRYVGDRRSGPVFLSRDGRPLSAVGVRKMLQRASRRAGLGLLVYPHLLRHTSATLYLANGGDTFTLQRIMGHSDPRMTERYVALSVGLLKDRHRRASPADRLGALGIQARLL